MPAECRERSLLPRPAHRTGPGGESSGTKSGTATFAYCNVNCNARCPDPVFRRGAPRRGGRVRRRGGLEIEAEKDVGLCTRLEHNREHEQ